MNSRIYYRCQMTGMENSEKSLWGLLVIKEMGFPWKMGSVYVCVYVQRGSWDGKKSEKYVKVDKEILV